MTLKTIFLCAAALAVAGATSLSAASPETPGAGGRGMSALTRDYISDDVVPGSRIRDLHNDEEDGRNLGERIRDYSDETGGTPTPGKPEDSGDS